MRKLLDQLPTPIIMQGDLNAHNTVWGSEKTSTRGKMIEKILDDYNLLCLNDKEETYYTVHDGCKSTIDLTLVSNLLAPELTRKKEYNLRGNDHFLIILKETGEITQGNNRDGTSKTQNGSNTRWIARWK